MMTFWEITVCCQDRSWILVVTNKVLVTLYGERSFTMRRSKIMARPRTVKLRSDYGILRSSNQRTTDESDDDCYDYGLMCAFKKKTRAYSSVYDSDDEQVCTNDFHKKTIGGYWSEYGLMCSAKKVPKKNSGTHVHKLEADTCNEEKNVSETCIQSSGAGGNVPSIINTDINVIVSRERSEYTIFDGTNPSVVWRSFVSLEDESDDDDTYVHEYDVPNLPSNESFKTDALVINESFKTDALPINESFRTKALGSNESFKTDAPAPYESFRTDALANDESFKTDAGTYSESTAPKKKPILSSSSSGCYKNRNDIVVCLNRTSEKSQNEESEREYYTTDDEIGKKLGKAKDSTSPLNTSTKEKITSSDAHDISKQTDDGLRKGKREDKGAPTRPRKKKQASSSRLIKRFFKKTVDSSLQEIRVAKNRVKGSKETISKRTNIFDGSYPSDRWREFVYDGDSDDVCADEDDYCISGVEAPH